MSQNIGQNSDSVVDRSFTAIATGAVVAAIVAGFWLLGSPGKQRLLSLDAQRIQDLSAIASQLSTDLAENGAIPEKPLPQELPERIRESFKDPETQAPYDYKRVDDKAYQLCATFALSSEVEQNTRDLAPFDDARWQHPAGLHCFEFEKLAYQPK